MKNAKNDIFEINIDYRRAKRDIENEIQVWLLRTPMEKTQMDIIGEDRVAVVYSVGVFSWNYSTSRSNISPVFVI